METRHVLSSHRSSGALSSGLCRALTLILASAGLLVAMPTRAMPTGAEPARTEPARAMPTRAEPARAGPQASGRQGDPGGPSTSKAPEAACDVRAAGRPAESHRAARRAPRRPWLIPKAQWLTLRTLLGMTALTYVEEKGEGEYGPDTYYRYSRGAHLGAEAVLVTLLWRRLYWEILRIGAGAFLYRPWVEPTLSGNAKAQLGADAGWRYEVIWGTALGSRIPLGATSRSELRLGIHLTFMQDNIPGYSGVQLLYQYRGNSGFGVQVGLMQTSLPLGALLVVGVLR